MPSNDGNLAFLPIIILRLIFVWLEKSAALGSELWVNCYATLNEYMNG